MWIPIALSRDVPAETTRAVVLEGRELALWRAESGAVQLWEDRCPHRGMRLSFGFVRGESLNCLYHGWQYGTSASCRRIPAHPDLDVPPTIRATAYRVVEEGGLIWTSDDAAEPSPETPAGEPLASLAVDVPASVLPLAASDGCQAAKLDMGGVAFYIGWHAVSPHKTMLHCVTVRAADQPVALR